MVNHSLSISVVWQVTGTGTTKLILFQYKVIVIYLCHRFGEKFDSLLSLLILEEEEESEKDEDTAEGEKKTPTEETTETKSSAKESSKISGELAGKSKSSGSSDKAAEGGGSSSPPVDAVGKKKEKNVMVIVEELRTLRDHQADLISQLMSELSHMERENHQLKSQVIFFHFFFMVFNYRKTCSVVSLLSFCHMLLLRLRFCGDISKPEFLTGA